MFLDEHTRFVTQRISKLEQLTPLRQAKLLPVVVAGRQKETVLEGLLPVCTLRLSNSISITASGIQTVRSSLSA